MPSLPSFQNGRPGRSYKLGAAFNFETNSGPVSVTERECTDPKHVEHKNHRTKAYGLLEFLTGRGRTYGDKPNADRRAWKPAALRAPVLLTAIVIPVALVLVLEWLLRKSQTEGAIFFTSGVGDLTSSEAFGSLYFPTSVAVLFSIFWSWIDLDAKRFEPYHQLAKPGGASGKDSLLLQYPFDFIASVPIKSLRRRHWPVFLGSTAIVCIFWGLTPSQAGMFVPAVVNVNKTEMAMKVSTGFLPVGQQRIQPFANYTYTAFAVNFLGAFPPGYVDVTYGAGSFALAPFEPHKWAHEITMGEMWTAATTEYGVEVRCAEPEIKLKPDTPPEEEDLPENSFYASWNGCEVPRPFGPTGNEISGGEGVLNETKNFSFFVASYTDNGHLGLSQYCPSDASRTFFVSFSKNRESETDLPITPITMFCEAHYYIRDVNATVLPDGGLFMPWTPKPLGDKRPLPDALFDVPNFERQVFSSGSFDRREIPGSAWPNMTEHLSARDITLYSDGNSLAPIAALSLGPRFGPVSVEMFLDRDTLHRSLQETYQLLFGVAIADVLRNNANESAIITGQRTYIQTAVALHPVFTRIVQGLLGSVTLLGTGLLLISWSKSRSLLFNPAPIAAVMSLVADNTPLLQAVKDHDISTAEQLEAAFGNEHFQLTLENDCSMLTRVPKTGEHNPSSLGPCASSYPERTLAPSSSAHPKQHSPGIRPSEFRLLTTTAFAAFQLALIIGLAVIYVRAKPYGFYWSPKAPGPVEKTTILLKESEFITQFLYTYLPIAVAAFIEPFWVVINRQMCLLQPFEDLRRGSASAKKTIGIDYLSLPPQLNIWRALTSGHVLLATVCAMALLANVLAVAFGGLFFFANGDLPVPAEFVQPPIPSLVGLESPFAPPGSIRQHQIAQSNLVSGTGMPPWTDDRFMYLPFFPPGYDPIVEPDYYPSEDQQAKTRAFGAQLDCVPLSPESSNSYTLRIVPDQANAGLAANLTVDVNRDDRTRTTCVSPFIKINNQRQTPAGCPQGPVAIEFINTMSALDGASPEERAFCVQYVVAGWVRNVGPDVCATMGYVKAEDGTLLGCRPRLVTGIAAVRTDFQGIKGKPKLENITSDGLQQYFADDPATLITRIQQFFPGNEATWHNDSFASDFSNYLMMKGINDTRMLDPSLPPPRPEEATVLFESLYSKLVAIYLGTYRDQLLSSSNSSELVTLAGSTFDSEVRVFVSTPMFILAEVILCIYVVVTVLVYLYRPERFLPRLPTTIASIIATFAAGYAVQDFQGTAHMGTKKRVQFTEELGASYAYGSFMGTDGKPHTGIEKEPLVTPLKHSTSSAERPRKRSWRQLVGGSSTSSLV